MSQCLQNPGVMNGRPHKVYSPARFVCLALVVFGSLYFGFRISEETSMALIRHVGYFLSLLTVVAFTFFGYRSLSPELSGSCLSQSRSKLLMGCAIILLGSWILFIHASFEYKIAMDDYILSSTAKTMHGYREVAYTSFGRNIGNTFVPIEVVVDKRPWLYPFAVASLHDLVGYHEINPFIVNAFFGVLFLIGSYLFGFALAGTYGGCLSVLLWVSLPLLSHNASGAGMEMLNLLCTQIVLLCSVYYLKQPSAVREGFLALSMVLLANARYESGLFVFPVIAVIAIGWFRSKRIFLSWGSVLSVVLLVPVLWQLRIYSATESSWEMASSASAPFGIANLAENFPHALAFFFNTSDTLGNSFLLSAFGLVGMIAFVFLLRTELKKYWVNNPAGLVLSIFFIFFLLHLALVLSFHSAKLDARFVSRYSLPFHFALVFPVIAILGYMMSRVRYTRLVSITLIVLFIHVFTLPTNSKAVPTQSNFLVREFNWLSKYADAVFEEKCLIIDTYTLQWALEERAALESQVVYTYASRVSEEIEGGKYSAAYLIQRLRLESGEFVGVDPIKQKLIDAGDVTLLESRSFRPLHLTRVYKIEGFGADEL